MTVAQEGGLVSVLLAADRPDTLDLLRRNIDLLARDLRELGFESLNFSFQHGAGNGAAPWQAETKIALYDGAARMDPSPAPHHQDLLAPSGSYAPDTSGGLDLRL